MTEPGGEIYTDVVMEMLTAYLLSESDDDNLIERVMTDIKTNPAFPDCGLMEGLVFSSIIHLSIMISYLSKTFGVSRQEILQHYALVYKGVREIVETLPEVHPDVVAEIARNMNQK